MAISTSSFKLLFGICLSLVSSVYSSLVGTGSTVILNEVYYFASPYPVGMIEDVSSKLNAAASVSGLVPMTVVGETFTVDEFDSIVSNYTAKDDVFQAGFLQVVYTESEIDATACSTHGIMSVITVESMTMPSGPYFVGESSGMVYPAYRLYSDTAGAFTESVLETPDGGFTVLSAGMPGTSALTVGVPSRLYYTASPDKPLAGVRVGVKDIYDIAGMRTGCGNRAYYYLYPPANATALAIQKLIDAGAVVVGKQKTSQFANGERATADWVDYHSPFNPRGDGYQDPSSSSAGAGASIGTYEWLDIAVGSDTGGSIRGPSGAQGLFGNRPSHNFVELTNVMPLAPELDTAGFLTRDPYLWLTAQRVLYGDHLKSWSSYPKTIYTSSFPTDPSESASNAILIGFLDQLASFLGAKSSALNLTVLWSETKPENVTPDLDSLLNLTYPILISQDQIRLVREPFLADYKAIHDGRLPFIDPAPTTRWAFGDSYPQSATVDAIANKTTFMDWFQSNVLKDDQETCSDSFLIYAGHDADDVRERNEYGDPPSVPWGFSRSRMSVFSEAPDSVFPVGQASFFSNITMHDEFLPVTIDIMAAKGCDAMIATLAQDLVDAGILSIPKTGRTPEDGGGVLHKRSTAWQ